MGTSDSFAFWIVLCIIVMVQVISPIVAIGLSESFTERDTPEFTSPPSLSDYFKIGVLEFVAIPFWTFSMPVYMNLFIMLPIRILGWVLLLRMIRGN